MAQNQNSPTEMEITGSERNSKMNGFLCHGRGGPLWNMALDSWLACEAPLSPGDMVLRLYHWEKGAITVGRNQLWRRALSLEGLGADEIAIRRITGGRAIYHDETEITYSVTVELSPGAQEDDNKNTSRARPLSIDKPLIRATSLKIGVAIVKFLRRLGLPAEIQRGAPRPASSRAAAGAAPACFGSVSRHEITCRGSKIAAGAQRILGTRYFQHGSLKLFGVAPHRALSGIAETVNGNKIAAIDCYRGQEEMSSPHGVAQAFRESFGDVFSCSLPEIALTEADRAAVTKRQSQLDYIQRLPDCSNSASLRAGSEAAGSLSPISLTVSPSQKVENEFVPGRIPGETLRMSHPGQN
ncbi:MAG: biotin/lipoate A/B protein ligase family protein [Candidatus Zixiibacteriota bacterium]